jgi:tRNA pseudouridine55 synthase
LLLLGVNAGTKLLTFLVGEGKTYEATIRLGASTITDDAEGDILSQAEPSKISAITADQVEAALANLRGDIMQVPSSVSAIKVDGERAYAKVRGGDEVKLAARPIKVSKFEITKTPQIVEAEGGVFLDFDAVIECSSGTYIRALARDLGESLQVGAHLTALRRTRIGSYKIEDAAAMQDLTRENLVITSMFDSVKDAFQLRELSEQEVTDLRHGKRIAANGATAPEIAGVHEQQLIAMLKPIGTQLKSSVVFAVGSDD